MMRCTEGAQIPFRIGSVRVDVVYVGGTADARPCQHPDLGDCDPVARTREHLFRRVHPQAAPAVSPQNCGPYLGGPVRRERPAPPASGHAKCVTRSRTAEPASAEPVSVSPVNMSSSLYSD